MLEHFERIKSLSREETFSDVDARSLPVKIRDAAAWLFSPYL
jgi:cardiolipin synthase